MADVSCRLARADDAPGMAAAQLSAWRVDRTVPAAALATLDLTQVAAAWREAVVDPPDLGHRVVVALHRDSLESEHVTGFLAWGPAGDPDLDPARDVEVLALVVDPGHRGGGHGSRLLAAWAELSGARYACWWLPDADEGTRAFLVSAGWAPDGATREVADDAGDRVWLARMVTAFDPA